MSRHYPSRSYIQLRPGTSYKRPEKFNYQMIDLEAPAVRVMTDFTEVVPLTVEPEIQIDLALARMKHGGVRLLLVTGPNDEIVGLVSAADIMGDKPVRIVQEQRIGHEDITVAHVMRPRPEIQVLDWRSVLGAQVGHIIETLRELSLKHILVVELNNDGSQQTVRGLFSSSQISRQLHRDVSDDMSAATSLSEMVHSSERA